MLTWGRDHSLGRRRNALATSCEEIDLGTLAQSWPSDQRYTDVGFGIESQLGHCLTYVDPLTWYSQKHEWQYLSTGVTGMAAQSTMFPRYRTKDTGPPRSKETARGMLIRTRNSWRVAGCQSDSGLMKIQSVQQIL